MASGGKSVFRRRIDPAGTAPPIRQDRMTLGPGRSGASYL